MKNKYPITATFIDEITYDIPSSNWTDDQWIADLDNMKEVGIDTVVLMRGAFYDKCLFPSKVFPTLKKEDEDFAGLIFTEATKRNMNVFLGLYITDLCWGDGDFEVELEKNKLFVDEVLERYGHIPSFKGWYIPHETAENSYNIAETMGALGKLCKEKAPDKKILISPYFKTALSSYSSFTPERQAREWDNIWSRCGQYIDYCAFQDGTASLKEYGNYLAEMKKVCEKYDIKLWANVETFERDPRKMFFPISFDILRKKIEIAEEYVEKCLTFEFSHFLSPQSIFPSARNLNTLYRNYYEKKNK
ncbi:MAG: DUF4434 domain-containing protein [Clostridia bacterium]|nr:DUF4434 domain-containing protein [Clostridia bacterium]